MTFFWKSTFFKNAKNIFHEITFAKTLHIWAILTQVFCIPKKSLHKIANVKIYLVSNFLSKSKFSKQFWEKNLYFWKKSMTLQNPKNKITFLMICINDGKYNLRGACLRNIIIR